MKKFLYVCVIALTAVAATGCGKKSTTRSGGDAASTAGTAGAGTGTNGAYGAGSGSGFAAGSLDDPSSPLSQRKIYFGLDRYDVSDEYRSLVEAHAGYLRGSPSAAVTLEGGTSIPIRFVHLSISPLILKLADIYPGKNSLSILPG